MVSKDDLVSIDVRSGVNERKEGFCTIVATAHGGRILLGQLTPNEVRDMALRFLGAAEAAETDAIVYQLLADKFHLEDNIIGHFIGDMRDLRD